MNRRKIVEACRVAMRAAMREQFGYSNVSNVRMSTLRLNCIECGFAMVPWRMHPGCWVCSNPKHMEGADWFWQANKHRRRYHVTLKKRYGNRYLRRLQEQKQQRASGRATLEFNF